MTTKIAAANNNLTNAATWQDADSTSLLVSSSNNTTLTTSYVSSSTFTPGAITIDGIAVWVNTRPGSTGTISVALDQATVTVVGTEVTIDVADIPSDGNCWVLFKFASPVLLLAATAYSVKAKTSSSSQVSLFRNATSNNWSRLLRTTTTGAPAAADLLYILGEKTGSGAQTTRTVTMDDAAAGATVYGQIDISAGGTMTYGTTASTAYYLKIAGNMNVRAGGTLNIGTVGTPMPSSSSGVLEFNCSTNVEFGLVIFGGGTCVLQGNAISNVSALLAADASAAATSLTTNISTGWKNGDEIALAPTTATASQSESKALTADASGTTLTITAITNAHSGTSPTQGELINLTRNVKIRGVSTSNQAYILVSDGATVDWDYAELYQLGSNTSQKRGIDFIAAASTSSVNVQKCSWHDFAVSSSAVLLVPGATINCTYLFDGNVSYNVNSEHWRINDVAMGTGSVTLSNHIAIRCPANSSLVHCLVAEATLDTITCTGAQNNSGGNAGLYFNGGSGTLKTLKNITVHSNNLIGLQLTTAYGDSNTDVQNITSWRNSGTGQQFEALFNIHIMGTNVSFGNTNGAAGNMQLIGSFKNCSWWNYTVNAGSGGFAATVGMNMSSTLNTTTWDNVFFYNCSFGAGTTHSTADITPSTAGIFDLTLVNCVLASSTEILNTSSFSIPGSRIRLQRLDATSGNHKTYAMEGQISRDTSIADVSPSVRLTPLRTATNLVLTVLRKQVASGNSATVNVKVRCSVIGDGAAYNGSRPRLIVKASPGCGITSDTVLDTATGASDGAFETLSGTTASVTDDCVLEFVVDCNGTAGWVNVDTLSAS